jgi:hypothetical protein
MVSRNGCGIGGTALGRGRFSGFDAFAVGGVRGTKRIVSI